MPVRRQVQCPGSRSPAWSGILAAVLVLGLPPGRAAAQSTVPRFERRACDFPLPVAYPRDIIRECGHIIVPEVRGRANGRTFRLAVVRYRAKEPDGSPPLLLIHGGPGGAGGTRFAWSEMQFPLVRKRDVVTFDMRGVGASEPQFCPDFSERAAPAFLRPTRPEWEAGYREAVRACVAEVEALGLDRSAYGADVTAADVIDLRRALGYAQWDLYGVSYGGEVAQELLRRDPQGTHAAVLVSSSAPGHTAAQWALSYQLHLQHVFASCAAQPRCHAAFPTLEADFHALFAELSANPVEVRVEGASPPRTVRLNGERLLMELRREFRQPGSVKRLPLLISELRDGDREAAFRRLIGDGVISPWDPIGRIVQCNEYGAGYRAAVAATKSMLRPAFQTIADDFREHCDQWLPNPTRQADTLPVVSDIPTLVLHGEYDPAMDVQAIQRRITAKLERAYAYTFPGETHANLPIGCHGSIIQQFLENPARAPDASCLARMPGIRFRTRGFEPTVTFVITARSNAQTPFAGVWEAALGGGPDWTIEIETEGRVVRGTVVESLLPVYDGRIDGATLSFKVKSSDNARSITFTGQLQGDELSFTRAVEVATGGNPGGPGLFGGAGLRAFTARRVR